MGVPSFYRWLANKYPKIAVDAAEVAAEDGGPFNPNGPEIHNLYLDMNGIIHPCFHPEDDDIHMDNPVSYEDVFNNIYEYIDRIMGIVRPRKLVYMAIDGVAPRAIMNQQRIRRFRTAKDRETISKEEDRLRNLYAREGKDVLPKEESEIYDSNVITPGTEFMYILSKKLENYIRLRFSNNASWKGLKVILSDANVPGEGEHKIMSFIRLQRTSPGYNPNTSHCLYGLDADLIMLALATHEIHFSILRENVLMQDQKVIGNSSVSFRSGEAENSSVKCRGWFKEFDLNNIGLKDSVEQMKSLEICSVNKKKSFVKKPYQFLHVWILREYLKLDMQFTNLPEKFEADFERILDDFIFICFFAGNDFLPHMPTLEIHEGAIDLLIHVYKQEFKNLGGYLVDMQRVDDKKGGYIKLKRVEKFILFIGSYEEKIFKKRSELRERKLKHILSGIERFNGDEESSIEMSTFSSSMDKDPSADIIQNTKKIKEQLKSYTRDTSDVFKNGLVTDKVKFGTLGWKTRYYKNKFFAESEEDMENTRKILVEKYTEGLCWVLLYYFSGVPSWTWFYPFHYGPFASDMKGLSHTKVTFQRGLPFKPFDQLMAVLPPMSSHALPISYQSLMSDNDSRIIDFYPNEFEVDTDGKRYLWQGICKLPFIEEERLLAETKKLENNLTVEESQRNTENLDLMFIHSTENLGSKIMSIYKEAASVEQNYAITISGDINGFVYPKLEAKNVGDSNVLCVLYGPPSFCVHIPRVLEGTNIREMVITEVDIEDRQLWHDNRPSNRWSQNQGAPYRNRSSKDSCPIIKGGSMGWRGRGQGSSATDRPWSPGCFNGRADYNRWPKEEATQSSWKSGRSQGRAHSGFNAFESYGTKWKGKDHRW